MGFKEIRDKVSAAPDVIHAAGTRAIKGAWGNPLRRNGSSVSSTTSASTSAATSSRYTLDSFKGDLSSGAKSMGESLAEAGRGVKAAFVGGGQGARGLMGGIAGVGRSVVAGTGKVVGKSWRGAGELSTAMPKTIWAIAAVATVGAVVKWIENRRTKRDVSRLRESNDALQAQLLGSNGIAVDPALQAALQSENPRERAAALNQLRAQTSADIGEVNPAHFDSQQYNKSGVTAVPNLTT